MEWSTLSILPIGQNEGMDIVKQEIHDHIFCHLNITEDIHKKKSLHLVMSASILRTNLKASIPG